MQTEGNLDKPVLFSTNNVSRKFDVRTFVGEEDGNLLRLKMTFVISGDFLIGAKD